MPFRLFAIGRGEEEPLEGVEPLALGEVVMGFQRAGAIAESFQDALASHGCELVGLWRSREPGTPDYFVVEGAIERDIAAEIADEIGFALFDFRQIVAPASSEEPADQAVRRGLAETASMALEPETPGCSVCGGYTGLHFTPPDLPHE